MKSRDAPWSISLACEYAAAPHHSWTSLVSAVVKRDSIVVRHDLDDRQRRRTLQLRAEPWRDLARYLAFMDDAWGIPAAAGAVEVLGLRGVEAQLVTCCWTRWGDERGISIGEVLVDLPKTTLSKLSRHHGTLRELGDHVSQARDDDSLAILTDLLEVSRRLRRRHIAGFLPRLIASHGTTRTEDPVGAALVAEASSQARRTHDRRRLAAPLHRAAGQVFDATEARPTGFPSGIAWLQKKQYFLGAVTAHVARFGRLPSGTFLYERRRFEFPPDGFEP